MIATIHFGFFKISFIDIVDFILIIFLCYQIYKLLKGSIALKISIGFLVIYFLYVLVHLIGMKLLTAFLGQFMEVSVLAVVILFQQEIRKFLFLLGRTTSFSKKKITKHFPWKKIRAQQSTTVINAVTQAAQTLAHHNTGALIVFSRTQELKYYEESGDFLHADISKRLIISIFNKTSPLHDGAIIIHSGKIIAARCILPVTEQKNLPSQFGLRHLAAIGMTEVTDTLILIVSEETGQIAIAQNSMIYENLSVQEIQKMIHLYFQ